MTIDLEDLAHLPAMMHTALEQAFNAVIITDANFSDGGPHIIYANKAFCRMTGYDLEELLGESPRILQGPDTDQEVIERLRESLKYKTYFHGSTVNYRKDGVAYDVEWNITPVLDVNRELSCFISIQQDVSFQKRAQRQMEMLAGALNCANDAIFVCDSSQRIVFVNESFERLTGYSYAEAVGNTPSMLSGGIKDEYSDETVSSAIRERKTLVGIMRNRHKNGDEYYVHQSISPLETTALDDIYFVSISKDITRRIRERQALEEMALQDSLTGVLNRRGAELLLASKMEEASTSEHSLAVIIADVDRFKRFNDSYGHEAGDLVLKEVATSLRHSLRDGDLVARWGGEEFLIALPGAEESTAYKLVERLRNQLAQINLEGLPQITASFGLAIYQPGESLAEALKRADSALYKAKSAGRNRTEIA